MLLLRWSSHSETAGLHHSRPPGVHEPRTHVRFSVVSMFTVLSRAFAWTGACCSVLLRRSLDSAGKRLLEAVSCFS